MRLSRPFAIMALILAFTLAAAAKVSGYKSVKAKSTGYITYKINAIDYRDDLTRIYGHLVGRPHTSERIDELTIITPDGTTFNATDIEGVDMKRWFQWEDEGFIEVEIDFPAMKPLKSFTIKSKGPKGESSANVTKTM